MGASQSSHRKMRLLPPPTDQYSAGQKLRPLQTTIKSECVTCRRRRNRCDGRKPACVGCERNSMICLWPDLDRPIEAYGHTPESQNLELLQRKPHVPRAPNHGCNILRDPGAVLLFDHYLASTAPFLAGRIHPYNPFVASVVPRALVDDMTMHSVLAISASHLRSRFPDNEMQTRCHYGLAILTLKHNITKVVSAHLLDLSVVVLTVMLLCCFEGIDGDLSGASISHLRAARQVMMMYLQTENASVDSGFRCFILELYAYLSLVSRITPSSEESNRAIYTDPLIYSLEDLRHESPCYGFLLGLSYPILRHVHGISLLARQRTSADSERKLRETEETYKTLERSLSELDLEESDMMSTASFSDIENPEQYILAAKAFQQAALAFLYTAWHGPFAPDDRLLERTDACVDEFHKVLAMMKSEWPVAATMMWPCIVAGSCMRKREHQEVLVMRIETSPCKMGSLRSMVELLRCIWSDNDYLAFGSFGIERAVKIYQMNISLG